MKLRKGFVSNSSTSSFICDVCASVMAGYDLSMSDAEMFECVNGHTICDCHRIESKETENLREAKNKELQEELDRKKAEMKECIDKNETGRVTKLLSEVRRIELQMCEQEEDIDERYDAPEIFCPVCQLQDLPNTDLVPYLLREMATTKEEVVRSVREKFDSYKSFKESLKGAPQGHTPKYDISE